MATWGEHSRPGNKGPQVGSMPGLCEEQGGGLSGRTVGRERERGGT